MKKGGKMPNAAGQNWTQWDAAEGLNLGGKFWLWKWFFCGKGGLLKNVCVRKCEIKTPAVHVIMEQSRLQTDAERKSFTLNSTQPVSGAGSGIVAGPDRVRRLQRGERGGVHGQRMPLRSRGATLVGVGWGSGWGREGRYWQIFMGCRCSICRCLIELCSNELVPPLICIRTIPNGGSGVSRASLDKMSSRLQTAEDVWTWMRLYSMTWILIDSNVCLSVWKRLTSVILRMILGLKQEKNPDFFAFVLNFGALVSNSGWRSRHPLCQTSVFI